MTMPTGSLDAQFIGAINVTTDAGITWLHSAFNDGTQLTFVNNFGPFEQGMFGPNFRFSPIAIPEPATVALVGFSIIGLLAGALRSGTLHARN